MNSIIPEYLYTVTTMITNPSHVTKSHKMAAKSAIQWVVRSRVEHGPIFTYHLETENGEIYHEQNQK